MIAYLTDGKEIFKAEIIKSIDELKELNKHSKKSTDGNLFWVTRKDFK